MQSCLELQELSELTQSELELWHAALANQPIPSGFLSPWFHKTVAEYRPSVKVVVARCEGSPVGFFPIDVVGRHARAAGLHLADFQGGVVKEGFQFDGPMLLKAAGVHTLHFDHLAEQPALEGWTHQGDESRFIDLSQGFAHYKQSLQRGGSRLWKQLNQKRRKMERQHGELRVDSSPGPEVLDWIIRENQEQRRRTKTFDVLQFDWVIQTIQRLREIETPHFSVPMSALYVRDELAAAHLCLRAHGAMNYWFTAYNHELAAFSPGLQLFLLATESYANDGVTRFDLGKGEERYKLRLCNGSTIVRKGTIDINPVRHRLRSVVYAGIKVARESPYANVIKAPLRNLKEATLRRTFSNSSSA